jgi:hypothetical protein
MNSKLSDGVDAYLRGEQERPLGDVRLASGRSLQPFSRGLSEAASNLLRKAMRALASDDQAGADSLVARAVALPYDEHEEWSPAASSGEYLLYEAVTDALEGSPADDSTWLDAALAVLAQAGPHAGPNLRNVLESLLGVYDLSKDERRRLRAAVSSVPNHGELVDQSLTDAGLSAALLDILATCNAYAAELAAHPR